jgi:two-component system, OmpR family, response regulator
MRESKARVLIVDDDPDTCEMMRIYFAKSGYEVVSAETVGEALRQVKTGDFDLILLDWFLEDGTGLDLCRAIRAFGSDTPIYYCTGNAYQSEVERGMGAGAQGYFIKPIDLDRLAESMSRQLAQAGDKNWLHASGRKAVDHSDPL